MLDRELRYPTNLRNLPRIAHVVELAPGGAPCGNREA